MKNKPNYFDTIADDFNGLWQMTTEYQNWMSESIVSWLHLDSDDIFVDLGGGTGLYTKLIAKKAELKNRALCVEPSENMLSHIVHTDIIEPVNADALSFAACDTRYDKILLKEMIHFVEDRKSLFEGIKRQLLPKGKILIVTRPKNTPLPFFKKALETFAQSQPSLLSLEKELMDSNMVPTSSKETFVFGMPKARWYDMLRNRFMSNLQDFTDEEIENGIAELEQKFEKQDSIEFRDEIIFLSTELR